MADTQLPSSTRPETLPAHEYRLGIARAVAEYHLGDDEWADSLIAAYCNPEQAVERLKEEQSDGS